MPARDLRGNGETPLFKTVDWVGIGIFLGVEISELHNLHRIDYWFVVWNMFLYFHILGMS